MKQVFSLAVGRRVRQESRDVVGAPKRLFGEETVAREHQDGTSRITDRPHLGLWVVQRMLSLELVSEGAGRLNIEHTPPLLPGHVANVVRLARRREVVLLSEQLVLPEPNTIRVLVHPGPFAIAHLKCAREVVTVGLGLGICHHAGALECPNFVIPSLDGHLWDGAVPGIEDQGLGVTEARGKDMRSTLAIRSLNPAGYACGASLGGGKLVWHVVLTLDEGIVHGQNYSGRVACIEGEGRANSVKKNKNQKG